MIRIYDGILKQLANLVTRAKHETHLSSTAPQSGRCHPSPDAADPQSCQSLNMHYQHNRTFLDTGSRDLAFVLVVTLDCSRGTAF